MYTINNMVTFGKKTFSKILYLYLICCAHIYNELWHNCFFILKTFLTHIKQYFSFENKTLLKLT